MLRSFHIETVVLLTIASEFEYLFSLKGLSSPIIGPFSFGGTRE